MVGRRRNNFPFQQERKKTKTVSEWYVFPVPIIAAIHYLPIHPIHLLAASFSPTVAHPLGCWKQGFHPNVVKATSSISGVLLIQLRTKTVEKPLNCFLLLHLNTKTKAKTVKPDTKKNVNLRKIEYSKNEPIRVELCRTRSVYEK
jgi:hypothetical protein